jgi:hypothetical protein
MAMTVAMMQVRIMRMPVYQPDMLMLVVCIMTMPVLVFHRVVHVVVLMLLGDVQPEADAHEGARDQQSY